MYESKLSKRSQQCGEKLKNKVILSDEYFMKESRRYNLSILINHHQDFKDDDTNTLYFIIDLSTLGIIFKALMMVY